MSEFAFIYVFLILFALCIASIFCLKVYNDRSVLEEEQDDIITRFLQKRQHMLQVNMPKITIKTYVILTLASPLVFGILFWIFFPNKLFALLLAIFTVLLPDYLIRTIIDLRKKKYEEKYVRALKSFSAGMKAGLSIQQAIKEVMNNQFVAEEIREGFRQIDADIRVGISIEDAFYSFAEKADNDDARDVASAIAMQAAVGGSEAKVVESIAQNIEDRLVTKKKIRSIFSSTDFMVNAFDIFPFLAVIFMYIGLPNYVQPVLEDPIALIIMFALLGLTLVGSIVIRKKINSAKGE
jgi:tight adherence protein B